MDLYHKDIRLPDNFRGLPPTNVNLKWTRHATEARTNDRYGYVPAWESINLREAEVIEVGMSSGYLVHLLIRLPYDGRKDILMAVKPIARRPWVVKTVWLNKVNDKHRTLNKSNYMK